MSVCKDLEPKAVFRYFEEIARIPHGSGNTKAISDYCVRFAKERGLAVTQDGRNNVIIKKPGSAGYEDSAPVILQGHMDMVCEKEAGCDIDFAKDGLSLYVDGDFLRARGTTLGGDDGIALAYAFALLDDDSLCHPPLEAVFTVDEETGMAGAEAIDLSQLQGRRLLNIDSDVEGVFTISCAGGVRADCELPMEWAKAEGVKYALSVHGLAGGHSGSEIHKERANAIVTAGRMLREMKGELEFGLASFSGGQMSNAIPREATAELVIDPANEGRLMELAAEWDQRLKREYQASDPGISLTLTRQGEGSFDVLGEESLARAMLFVRCAPWGVLHMSMELPGMVETSLNPGILTLGEKTLRVCFLIRSSVGSRKQDALSMLTDLAEFLRGSVATSGDYPAWEYQPESELRLLMAETYRDLFGQEPKIESIHAGLECGLFAGKLPDLDCISFGPDNHDIHTPQERLSISSTERVWRLLVEFLRRAK